ncbi:MAG: ComF family protein [bacterium]
MITYLKKCLGAVIDFVYPNICRICKSPNERFVCQKCLELLPYISEPYCQRCAVGLRYGGEFCINCEKSRFFVEFIRAAFSYEGVVRRLILEFKYQKKIYIGKFLANLVCDYMERNNIRFPIDLIMPVPLHNVTFRERGFNQSEVVGDIVSKYLGLPLKTDVVRRIRKTKPQYLLNREARKSNLANAFVVEDYRSVKNKNVLLIDDIATSLSTFNEVARVLKEAGAADIFGLAIAKD